MPLASRAEFSRTCLLVRILFVFELNLNRRSSHEVLRLYDVSQSQVATYTRVASPGCAASSGFLNLLTPSSTCDLPALFHAGSVPELSAYRGFPPPVAGTPLGAPCPPCRFTPVSAQFAKADFLSTGTAASRIAASSGSVSPSQCYPVIGDRSSPGLLPLRGHRLESRPHASMRPPLVGFGVSLNGEPSISTPALQSLKEPEVSWCSFELRGPP